MPEEYPKQIKSKTQETFQVEQFGLYVIEITARCEKNNDLKVEIDNIQFREIPPENNIQSYNIPASWNGTNLKGLSKTIYFILTLNKGEHTLTFTPKDNSVIENWKYTLFTDTRVLNFENLPQVEDGDRRPLCSFILVDTPLRSITADVSVSWHKFDGDDVKIIINNEIQQDTKSRFWKNWVWHGLPIQIFTGAKRGIKTFIKNLDSDTHYIEFWVDKTPTLHKITLNLGNYNPKRTPTVEDPKWTGDFYDDTDQILLARLIIGEMEGQSEEAKVAAGFTVLNRIKKQNSNWGYNLKEVILKEDQYDAFWNKDTSEKVRDPLNHVSQEEWKRCYKIASDVLLGSLYDISFGATNFFSTTTNDNFPFWATKKVYRTTIGITYFYELNN